MESFRQDVRFTLRSLRRSPTFTTTAIGVLAIGIGMAVAMFTIFRTVLVAKLPVVAQDRVAVMWTYRVPSTEFACSAKCLDEIRRRSTTMSNIAPVVHWGAVPDSYDDGGHPVPLIYADVGANFFDVLGARAALGRLFVEGQDDAPAAVGAPLANPAPLNAVISYGAWKQQFHGDPSIIGRRIVESLFKQPYNIIGVAPPGLDYPSGVQMWLPIPGGHTSGYEVIAVARLKPGATIVAARDEYLALTNTIDPALKAVGAHAQTFGETVLGSAKPVIIVLTAAVALLLLLTCLNVGNLLLLRASNRVRELGLRRMLGATYVGIVRQLLIEAALLATAGGTLGFVVSRGLLGAARRLASRTLPRVDQLAATNEPLLLAVVTTLIAMMLFGLVPSLVVARASYGGTLRIDSHTGNETRRRRTLRQLLVAAQVALAMVTLGGAGLLVESLERLERQDAGYQAEHLVIAHMTWDVTRIYAAPGLSALARRLDQRIGSLPGVTAASPIVVPPLIGTGVWKIQLEKEGQTAAEALTNPTLNADIVGPNFFKTFATRVIRGRAFNADDQAMTQLVAVVDEAFAQRYWPGEDPIGKRIALPWANNGSFVGATAMRTVVGVVASTRLRTIREATPMIYFPVTQGYWQGDFALRTAQPLEKLRPLLDAALRDVDARVQLQTLNSMDALLDVPLAEPRLSALLMAAFGFVALLLCAIGLYGVMASLVRDQTRDIGIRMALGATASNVRNDVLSHATKTIAVGAAVGIIAAVSSARVLAGLLYEVKPNDPLALAGAALVLIGAGVIAAYIPARRATRINPVAALRE